jgi:hypothetical protein
MLIKEKNQNLTRETYCSYIEKPVTMPVLSKLNYRFGRLSIKISVRLSINIEERNSKIHLERQKNTQITKTIFKKVNKVQEVILFNAEVMLHSCSNQHSWHWWRKNTWNKIKRQKGPTNVSS